MIFWDSKAQVGEDLVFSNVCCKLNLFYIEIIDYPKDVINLISLILSPFQLHFFHPFINKFKSSLPALFCLFEIVLIPTFLSLLCPHSHGHLLVLCFQDPVTQTAQCFVFLLYVSAPTLSLSLFTFLYS
jgi:hypothetical protein